MNTSNAIEVTNLQKKFGSLTAVNKVSFSIPAGSIFSLLGPNGAGKSTTISILSGLLAADGGEVVIMGHSLRAESQAARSALGVVPQEIALYPDLSARENLVFWGKMYGLRGARLASRVQAILEMIGLCDRQNDRVGTFSGGMKRRVNIGAALLHNPPVVMLDEPTVGIDPQSRRHILDSITELNRQGTTVLYTTHYMEEAQELSDQIAILDHGEIIACGTLRELLHLVGEQTRVELTLQGEGARAAADWQSLAGVSQVSAVDGKVTLLTNDSNRVLPRLFESAPANDVRIQSVALQEPNLEAVFLHLTGRALRD